MLDDEDFREVEEPPALGHNQPPDEMTILRQRLEINYADLIARRDELLAALKKAPIVDHASASRIVDAIKIAAAFCEKMDEAHKSEADPINDSLKTIRDFFNTLAGPIQSESKQLRRALVAWRDSGSSRSAVRGEYGAVASFRGAPECAQWDSATIDLEALRKFIPASAIEQAIRAFIRAGGRELRGAEIREKTRLTVS